MRRPLAVAASLAVVYKLFGIEENKEEVAEKTPSTYSIDKGYQHFSHLVYCDTALTKFRTTKCLGHLHIVSMPLALLESLHDVFADEQ